VRTWGWAPALAVLLLGAAGDGVLPTTVRGYSRVDSPAPPDTGAVISAAYRNANGQVVQVTFRRDSAINGAQRAATAYLDSMYKADRAGQFEAYKVAFDNPDTAHASDRAVIGQRIGIVVRKANVVSVWLWAAYEVPHGTVIIVGNVSLAAWRQTDILLFARDLATAMQG
jgi:hypothetical protein